MIMNPQTSNNSLPFVQPEHHHHHHGSGHLGESDSTTRTPEDLSSSSLECTREELRERVEEKATLEAQSSMASSTSTHPTTDSDNSLLLPARRNTITAMDEEEEYPDPDSLQEELNEILEAWFEVITEEDIVAYQRYLEDIRGQRIAEGALKEPNMAPTFSLVDQDGQAVRSPTLNSNTNKPMVLVFYRGKWCPHCNATLMRYQKDLVPTLQKWNVPLVAVSPMLPDGTLYLATKRNLQFSVCTDPGNALARQFGITFEVQPHTRPFMEKWGEDVPAHSGDWTLPLPTVYVIGPDGRIAWSFVDNDTGVRADPDAILQAVAASTPVEYFTTTISSSRRSETANPVQLSQGKEIQEAGDNSGATDNPAPVCCGNKKKKRLFNRKSGGYMSLRKNCKGLLSSLHLGGHTRQQQHQQQQQQQQKQTTITECKSAPLAPTLSTNQLHSSVRASSSSNKTSFRGSSHSSRTFRGSQTSSEFLSNYVLPPASPRSVSIDG